MKKFGENVMAIFADMNTDYDGINNLMQDLAMHREIFADGEAISKAEAEAKVLEFSRRVLEITDPKNAKEVKRCFRDNGRQWFDIIEDTLETSVTVGLQQNDWFNSLVESKDINYHDRVDFVVEDDALLVVAKAGESHNDHILQRLGGQQSFSIPTSLYVVKIGADINKYIAGQEDWSRLVDKITESYIAEIQTQVYAEVSVAATKLPVQTGFVGTGALSQATKAQFDAIIENVSAANNGASVVVMGTKSALAKINALADVQWGAVDQKNSVMNTGNIGIYEGTRLVEMPNRFTDKTFTSKVFPSNVLMIMPAIGDEGKFVKFVDELTTEVEKTERGDYVTDLMTLQVSRRFGVGTVIGRQFGQWTI
jgi:hypothetical protein